MNNMENSLEMGRPEIFLEDLILDKAEDAEFEGDDCLYIQIPLNRTVNNQKQYDNILKKFTNKYIQDNGNINLTQNPVIINFVIDDGYFLNTFIKINHFGCIDYECLSEQIQLSKIEQARIDLVLLKFTNPYEYLRQYTRQQFANRPEIKNKFGFVMDEIDDQQLYKSVWITPDYKLCLIGSVSQVGNPESKMQIRNYNKIGA